VGRIDGRLAARYQLERDSVTLSLGGAYDLGQRSLGLSTALAWSDAPWRLDVSAGATYRGDQAAPWSASVTLSTRYAFHVAVPDAVVSLAGGRDVGTIAGRVLADDASLEGIELTVGRYRVRTEEDGSFVLTVPPGRYELSVDLVTLPLAYQLEDGGRATLEVRRGETTEHVVSAVRTTVLRGRVLADRDGDAATTAATAAPAVGVRARLVVTDAQGLRRTVVTDDDGAFEVRGLLAGATRVVLVDVPAGATVTDGDVREVQLEVGVPGDVTFAVRPAVVAVRAFTSQAVRIRSVALEVDRAPPGTAPLVRVDVQGEADAVRLVTADGADVALEPHGDGWRGRLPVPVGHAGGLLTFTVVARAGESEVTRSAQLIVDVGAPALHVSSDAPVRPGGVLTVRVHTYFEASAVRLGQPFGDDLRLAHAEPGRWSGTVDVPAGTSDAVYELEVRVERVDGTVVVEPVRFRVLAP
ncbi:MAG: hypothetical protein EA416_14440, partial [Trueperaceae bacterium]